MPSAIPLATVPIAWNAPVGERVACEHRHDADQPVADHERIAGERDHPLAPAHSWSPTRGSPTAVIGQMGPPLLGDEPDLELADRTRACGPSMCVYIPALAWSTSTSPAVIERPDPRERAVEVADHRLAAMPEHVGQAVALDQERPPRPCRGSPGATRSSAAASSRFRSVMSRRYAVNIGGPSPRAIGVMASSTGNSDPSPAAPAARSAGPGRGPRPSRCNGPGRYDAGRASWRG